jgi:hypothetical protein
MRPRYLGIAVLVAAAIAATTLAVSTAGSSPTASKTHSGKKAARQGLFFAVLSGKKEISATTGKKGAGDLDGRGGFSGLIHDDDTFCFGITVTGLDTPILAHIHKGTRKQNGPIVITLTPPSGGNPGASSGCVSADPTLLADIRKHPRKYYANVHTNTFTGGAVRGQLVRANGSVDK